MTAVIGGAPARARTSLGVPVKWRLTWATARRVLSQLRHDPRTVVMLIAVPSLLMVLLRYVLDNPVALNRFAPEFIGVFPFFPFPLICPLIGGRPRNWSDPSECESCSDPQENAPSHPGW